MQSSLRSAVEDALETVSTHRRTIESARPLGGGCINQVACVELSDGSRVLVKANRESPPDMFVREAEGLRALRECGAIRVPAPLATGHDDSSGSDFLITEWIEEGGRPGDFSARFGQQLAELHRRSQGKAYGFAHDNYLGSTQQPNGWHGDWPQFVAEQRLGFQLRLAKQQGLASEELLQRGQQLTSQLAEWLAPAIEPPTLIHGDLWGGNYLADTEGQPVLIDPAAYYGHREAELAMTFLFGGFDRDFYAAYREAWPLTEGWEQRVEIYKLYHLLNHLNLFGRSYLSSCLGVLRQLTSG